MKRSHQRKRTRPPRHCLDDLAPARDWSLDSVWIMGVEHGVLPHMNSPIEEERRLCYVGMTRAKTPSRLFPPRSRKVPRRNFLMKWGSKVNSPFAKRTRASHPYYSGLTQLLRINLTRSLLPQGSPPPIGNKGPSASAKLPVKVRDLVVLDGAMSCSACTRPRYWFRPSLRIAFRSGALRCIDNFAPVDDESAERFENASSSRVTT